MSRILQSHIFGQIISRSFSRGGFCSTKYSLSVAPGHFCESCGINGTHKATVANKFKYGFTTPSLSVQSSKFHTSLSTYSEESQEKEKRGEVEKSPRNEERGETIIERLRRLSQTDADDYELSPVAHEKARQMAEVRAESIRKGEHWKWDQRNVRPGGFPQQNQGYNNNYRNRGFDRYDRSDEDFYGGGGGRQQGYNNRDRGFNRYDRDDEDNGGGRQQGYNRNRSFDRFNRDDEEFDTGDLQAERSERSTWRDKPAYPRQAQYGQRQSRDEEFDDNGPQDYEQEMEKLRERLQKTKAEKARLTTSKAATPSEDVDSHERSSGASKSSNLHQNSTPRSQNLFHEQSYRYVRPDKPFSDARQEPLHNQNQNEPEFQYPREDQLDLALAGYDPDSFGTLTVGSTSVIVKDIVGAAIQKELNEDAKTWSITNDKEEEEDDTRYIPPYGKRWSSAKLIKKVRELLAENKIKDAVDTFLGVLKQGGFDFDHEELRHHFHVLINECAKVGYVEMAFKLFNLMKKRGYKEKDRTISCLLNACANSPWDKENNLDRIENLLILNKEKGFDLNLISYTALIKAYGRLGETLLAFNVVDQMINESKIAPDTIVFNMLLQACITDTKNGFRHALVTWRKMHSLGLRPDTFTFNLLLRAIRDCGIEVKSIEGLSAEEQQQKIRAGPSLPLLPPVITEEDSNRVLSFLCAENPSNEETRLVLDNLGEPSIISAKAMAKALSFPENRLAMLGGLRGMVSKMARSKVGPNLKTLTELMCVTHPSEFIDIMRLLKDYKIKPDAQFFTVAIARCNFYHLHHLSKEMLKQMSLYNVSPNIVTWGALALGCDNWKEGKSYLEEMEEAKFTPNTEVMYSLLYTAVKRFDPLYVCHIMEETRRRNITLNEKYLILLEKFYAVTQRGLISKEMGKPVESKRLEDAMERNPDLPEHFSKFKMRYPVWLKIVEIKIDPENPWKHEFEKFKTHGRHTTPEKGVKEDEDFPYEPEKIGASSEIK